MQYLVVKFYMVNLDSSPTQESINSPGRAVQLGPEVRKASSPTQQSVNTPGRAVQLGPEVRKASSPAQQSVSKHPGQF